MKPLLDGAMELPLDKYRIRIDELKGNWQTRKNVRIRCLWRLSA